MASHSEVWDRAERLIRKGEQREALPVLNAWLADHQDDVYAWELLAVAHFDIGEWAEAERASARAIEAGVQTARAWSNWGASLRKLGRLDEAEQAQSKALSLDPSYERASAELAKAQRDRALLDVCARRSRRKWILVAATLAGLVVVAGGATLVLTHRRPSAATAPAAPTVPPAVPGGSPTAASSDDTWATAPKTAEPSAGSTRPTRPPYEQSDAWNPEKWRGSHERFMDGYREAEVRARSEADHSRAHARASEKVDQEHRWQTRGEVRCPICRGVGKVPCKFCDGSGYVVRDSVRVKCPECAGSGQTTCKECAGSGWTRKP